MDSSIVLTESEQAAVFDAAVRDLTGDTSAVSSDAAIRTCMLPDKTTSATVENARHRLFSAILECAYRRGHN
jgi:hypothetical protein